MNSNIIDAGDLRKYRTEIPNIIDDMDLSVYAFRLYVHIKRVAGANGGQCWQSTRTMADTCKMSIGMVSKAKQELVEAGLITLTQREKEKGETDLITIVDIWAKNFAAFSSSEQPVHTVNTPCSPGEHPVHVVNKRSNPIKNKPIEENNIPPSAGASASPPAPSPAPTVHRRSKTEYVNPDTGVSTSDILEAYKRMLMEHEPGVSFVYGQEALAAKSLAQLSWSPSDVEETYLAMRRENRFWDRKHLSLMSVGKQIGAIMGRKLYVAANGQGSIYNDELIT